MSFFVPVLSGGPGWLTPIHAPGERERHNSGDCSADPFDRYMRRRRPIPPDPLCRQTDIQTQRLGSANWGGSVTQDFQVCHQLRLLNLLRREQPALSLPRRDLVKQEVGRDSLDVRS